MTADELVDAYVRANETCDTELFTAVLAPGATAWRSCDDLEWELAPGVRNLVKMHERLADLRYEEVERVPIPGGVVLRQLLRATVRETGARFASHRCKLIRIAGDKITHIDEYVDVSPI